MQESIEGENLMSHRYSDKGKHSSMYSQHRGMRIEESKEASLDQIIQINNTNS